MLFFDNSIVKFWCKVFEIVPEMTWLTSMLDLDDLFDDKNATKFSLNFFLVLNYLLSRGDVPTCFIQECWFFDLQSFQSHQSSSPPNLAGKYWMLKHLERHWVRDMNTIRFHYNYYLLLIGDKNATNCSQKCLFFNFLFESLGCANMQEFWLLVSQSHQSVVLISTRQTWCTRATIHLKHHRFLDDSQLVCALIRRR